MLSLVISWGYVATCTNLRTVADRLQCRAPLEMPLHPIILYRPVRVLDRSPKGCKVPGTSDQLWHWWPGSLMDRIFLSWGKRPLSGGVYPMLEWSWWLCMFLWKSCYVRQWRDGFSYSSVCCQVHMGACCHILSCQALNAATSQGPSSSGFTRYSKAPRRDCRGLGTYRAMSREGSIVGKHMVKSCLSVTTVMEERTGTDHSRVYFF
jgi:hypothetical protein